jgi:hypothetical protein
MVSISKTRNVMETQLKGNGPAEAVMHCAIYGASRNTTVRTYAVYAPRPYAQHKRPYAQHKVSVTISWVEPRKRKSSFVTITPDNVRYWTIEKDGKVIYDTRADVPCDMVEFEKANARFRKMEELNGHIR